ncbi:MAG: DUF4325 domain-containing protein [bacterium]|nr:DUF4325 domain-containing protein [bacterium]
MDIKSLILAKINQHKTIKSAEIVKQTGFSRNYVNRALQELRDEGKIILLGKARQAIYVVAEKTAIAAAKKNILEFTAILENKNLNEDIILKKIQDETGVFLDLPENVKNIVSYAFLEMLNNAIDHSQSKKILLVVNRDGSLVTFLVDDLGVGIFNSIKNKFKLPDNMSAIQELLKGKTTTAPKEHTGQGIFFTSKMADSFVVTSGNKRVRFLNKINDVFIEDFVRGAVGTKVFFTIDLNTKRTAQEIFGKYTNHKTFEFSKTRILIRLYNIGVDLLSRSEARRIMLGLEQFKEITLDFAQVATVGQGFADEIFRVWQNAHSDKNIIFSNANDNVATMIKMAL